MTQTSAGRSSSITGLRVVALVIIWLGIVYMAAAPLGLYYETLAAWYTIPALALVYTYCIAHRGRATAYVAVVATLVVVLIVGIAAVFPEGSAA